jgi:hypothetical protein
MLEEMAIRLRAGEMTFTMSRAKEFIDTGRTGRLYNVCSHERGRAFCSHGALFIASFITWLLCDARVPLYTTCCADFIYLLR